jgi:hypothetical protein
MDCITKDKLLKTAEKTVEILGLGAIKIRKLTVEEMLDDGTDGKKKTFRLLCLSLVSPAITEDEARKIPADISIKIQGEILKFNGVDSGDEKKS